MAGLEAKAEVNTKEILKRFRAFNNELMELCSKYDLEPQLAKDDETKDNFIIINVKDFIKEEDIKIDIKK